MASSFEGSKYAYLYIEVFKGLQRMNQPSYNRPINNRLTIKFQLPTWDLMRL